MATPPVTMVRRRLSLFDVLCIGVNSIVGSGVFALPDDMQRAMGGYSPLAYVLCAALLLPVALCFAELSGRFDETGGAYVYARHAFGERAGFFVGWYCWMNTFVSWAANTTFFVELVGFHSFPINKVIVGLVIVGLGLVNYFGVKQGAWVVNLVVIGKTVAIFCFLAVAAMSFSPARLGGTLPHGAAGVGQGIYLALFPLQGFEVTPVAAAETENPKRNVPLATIGSILFATVLFTLVQAALVGTYPSLADESSQPLVDGARYLGPTIGVIVLVGSMVSIGGFTAGSALGSPRYAQAIAAQKLLPARLADVHPRWGTPHIAIAVTTGLTVLLALFFDYRKLVDLSNVTVVVQYVSTCLAVLVLRKRRKPSDTGWVVPGGAVVPVLGAVGPIAFLAQVRLPELLFSVATLILGVLVVVALGAARRKRAV
jgi:amino acid transporter